MAEYLNAECSICGTKYHRCDDCANMKSFAPWRKIVDSSECYKIYMILRDYTNKHIDKSEAKALLGGCSLKNKDAFKENVKAAIDEILKEDEIVVAKSTKKSTAKNANKIVDALVEDEDME